MLSADVIARIKALSLKGRHLASDVMSGNYASAFHGRGMEFHEVRDYSPGDDVRNIDWNVTARMNQPFVKVFREERELTLMLIVDVSASMDQGAHRSRLAAAAEFAAILAWLANRSNDRVGLLLFGQSIELYVPPRKGQSHIFRMIKELLTWRKTSPKTNIKIAIEHLAKIMKRRCVCFIISDYLVEEGVEALASITHRHDVTCVQTRHEPMDGALDNGGAGVVRFRDIESGEMAVIDTSDVKEKKEFEARHQSWEMALESSIRKAGADFIQITTDRPVIDPLEVYLRDHKNRARRKIS